MIDRLESLILSLSSFSLAPCVCYHGQWWCTTWNGVMVSAAESPWFVLVCSYGQTWQEFCPAWTRCALPRFTTCALTNYGVGETSVCSHDYRWRYTMVSVCRTSWSVLVWPGEEMMMDSTNFHVGCVAMISASALPTSVFFCFVMACDNTEKHTNKPCIHTTNIRIYCTPAYNM